MGEYLVQLNLRLSSTARNGRYTLKIDEYPIVKATEKTFGIKKSFGEFRVLKTELGSATPVLRNDKLSALGFSTYCLKEEIEESIKFLEDEMESLVEKIKLENKNAIESFEKGLVIKEKQ